MSRYTLPTLLALGFLTGVAAVGVLAVGFAAYEALDNRRPS